MLKLPTNHTHVGRWTRISTGRTGTVVMDVRTQDSRCASKCDCCLLIWSEEEVHFITSWYACILQDHLVQTHSVSCECPPKENYWRGKIDIVQVFHGLRRKIYISEQNFYWIANATSATGQICEKALSQVSRVCKHCEQPIEVPSAITRKHCSFDLKPVRINMTTSGCEN